MEIKGFKFTLKLILINIIVIALNFITDTSIQAYETLTITKFSKLEKTMDSYRTEFRNSIIKENINDVINYSLDDLSKDELKKLINDKYTPFYKDILHELENYNKFTSKSSNIKLIKRHEYKLDLEEGEYFDYGRYDTLNQVISYIIDLNEMVINEEDIDYRNAFLLIMSTNSALYDFLDYDYKKDLTDSYTKLKYNSTASQFSLYN